MRGRKPKPTKTKALQGTTRRDRHNPDEPTPTDITNILDAKVPDHLRKNKVAKEYWGWIIPTLRDMGVLTVADLGTVTLLTEVWCGLRETWDMMTKYTRITYTEKTDSDGNSYFDAKSSPAAVQYNNLLTQYRAFSAMFGLDPMSRPRLKVEKGKDEGEFEEFLGKGK